jgi:predicted nucleotidyltransferase
LRFCRYPAYIFAMLDQAIRTKLVGTKSALAKIGIAHMAVFGSRVRGQAIAESDIDILIDILPDTKFSLFDLVGVEQTLSEATGLRANAVMRRSLDAAFKTRIDRDTVEIF